MAIATPPAAPRASRAGSLLVAALVVALGVQLAHWTWVFVAPSRLAAIAPADEGADLAVAARLFGATASGAAPAAASSLRLKGVVAPTPGTAASAIFNTGSGKDISVYLGGEVQPGVKLVEVLPEAAVVSRGGMRERIALEARKAASPNARSAAATQFRLNVATSGGAYTLSRKQLDDTLRDPQQLNFLGRIGANPSGSGVRMEAAPAGSLAAKLGLQQGDVIKRVNGQTLLSPGDLALLYQRFNTLSTIQAEVQRGGATVQLNYVIQP